MKSTSTKKKQVLRFYEGKSRYGDADGVMDFTCYNVIVNWN